MYILGKKVNQPLRLLLIEDDPSLQEELVLFLSDFFEVIDPFFTAEEAYTQYLNSSYDLVMSDIQLPHTNGLALIGKIKKKKYLCMRIGTCSIHLN